MGRPPLPLGTAGKIGTVQLGDGSWRARCNWRGWDGVTRPIARYAETEAKARRKLNAEISARIKAGGLTVTPDVKVARLVDDWLDRLDEDARLAVGTRQQYRKATEAYVKPAIGSLRLGEVNVVTADKALRAINKDKGHSIAKLSRAVMSGAFALATQHGALPSNPMRDVSELNATTKAARGLTPDQVTDLCDRLRTSQRALELDLPDLVEFALATGARIGELLAARDETIDLDAGTWHVDATVVRVTGKGLMLQPPKTPTSNRVLALPPFAVDMLHRRQSEVRLRNPQRTVFPAVQSKKIRDPSNCAGDLREVLAHLACACDGSPGCKARGPYAWVTFHTFRKTVLTMFDIDGQSALQAAAQAGHARPSFTMDRYYVRGLAATEAARILDR